MSMELIGHKMKALREKRGYNLTELGEKIGYDPSNLGKLEKGKREPRISLLNKLAKFYNVDISYFFEDYINEIDEEYTEAEKELLDDLHLTEEELLKKHILVVDGKEATETEVKLALETIRSLRKTLGS